MDTIAGLLPLSLAATVLLVLPTMFLVAMRLLVQSARRAAGRSSTVWLPALGTVTAIVDGQRDLYAVVEFTTPDGEHGVTTHTQETGSPLRVGDRVLVQQDAANPHRGRVERVLAAPTGATP